VGYRRPLFRAQHVAIERESLPLAKPFVAEKEECVVFENRAAERPAELIAFEGRLLCGIEKVARIEHIVSEELEQLAVSLVRACARRYVCDSARATPVFRAEGRVVYLELLNRIDRRLE